MIGKTYGTHEMAYEYKQENGFKIKWGLSVCKYCGETLTKENKNAMCPNNIVDKKQ